MIVDTVIDDLNRIAQNKYESFRDILILKDSIYMLSERTLSVVKISNMNFANMVFVPVGSPFDLSNDVIKNQLPINNFNPNVIIYLNKQQIIDFIERNIKPTPARLSKANLIISICDNKIYFEFLSHKEEIQNKKWGKDNVFNEGKININLGLFYFFIKSQLLGEIVKIKIDYDIGVSIYYAENELKTTYVIFCK